MHGLLYVTPSEPQTGSSIVSQLFSHTGLSGGPSPLPSLPPLLPPLEDFFSIYHYRKANGIKKELVISLVNLPNILSLNTYFYKQSDHFRTQALALFGIGI